MTDSQFQKLLYRTAAAQRQFHDLLKAAEAEYERRYGSHPSDVDDDTWIDGMTGAGGRCRGLTVAEVEGGARLSIG
jgi:hypothetical protein